TLGYQPIAGINGDYFSLSSGIPTGLLITEGVLRSSEHSSWPAVGFFADGSAIIGRPELDITAKVGRKDVTIYDLNKAVYEGSGITLLTDSFSATTRVAVSTFNVVLGIDSGSIAIGDEISCTVLEKLTTSSPIDIAEGTAVLCAPVGAVNHTGLTSLQVGDTISISFSGDAAWEDVVYAVGGAEMLLDEGEVVAPSSSAAPRTALGIKADGSVLLYTVDGRQSGYSSGATLPQLAQRLQELGCVSAINLDGGGSTTAAARYPGEEDFVIVNRPSGGSQRQCANFIFLVNTAPASGVAEHLFIYPYSGYALAGAPLQFDVTATDNAFRRTNLPGAVSFSSDLGSINASGLLSSRSNTGSGTVSVTAGGLSAAADITLINKPDAISLSSDGVILGDATISLLGGESIDFDAVVYYQHMEILSGDAALTWSVEGGIGSVDAEGRFSAHSYLQEGSGYVVASYGKASAKVPVSITARGQLLEDFEGDSSWFGSSNSWWQVSENSDLTKVRYGYKSAQLDYTAADKNSFISLPISFSFTESPESLNFWIYGDGSGNLLTLDVMTAAGLQRLTALSLDFNGWQNALISLPEGTTAVTGIGLLCSGATTGTLYLDQFIASWGYYVDTEAPTVLLEVGSGMARAAVSDALDSELLPENIRLTYDGAPLEFRYDAATKVLNAELPADDGSSHLLALTAADRSGNIARV
ncbi:MAG: phosphodiester glycosidase family protein, partial [Firmicutes bacterium]|nr:phosphodiester glycosidase family protein [Bacillota bacterium]